MEIILDILFNFIDEKLNPTFLTMDIMNFIRPTESYDQHKFRIYIYIQLSLTDY